MKYRNSKMCIFMLVCFTQITCGGHRAMTRINSSEAPEAIGPYSHAVKTGNLIFCSGQLGLLSTGELSGNDIESQTRQSILNTQHILNSAGSDLSKITKVTIFLTDMKDYAKVNSIYAEYFDSTKPARSTVQVAKLPKNGLIEIECTAIVR